MSDTLEAPGRVITDPRAVRRFATAGNARITLRSKKSGKHYTYKVAVGKPKAGKTVDPDLFFVSLLTGPDNLTNYSYIGILKMSNVDAFRTTPASKLPASAEPVKAVRFFCEKVLRGGVIPEDLEIRHEGRCGKCSKVLTHPESIDCGIGPDCRAAMEKAGTW
jgi:hypothetical protein